MIRVHIICEGHTEEMFVNELLAAPLLASGVVLLPAKIGRPGHKGGNVHFDRLRVDIRQRLLGDTGAWCTTLLDYYGLPADFPGKGDSTALDDTREKLHCVVQSLAARVSSEFGESAGRRFIPYVQMFEFEGLLFSEPEILAKSIEQPSLAVEFLNIRKQFESPEAINDSPQTAPSKRIAQLFDGYDKPVHPLLAAREIGLDAIRRECRLFDAWVKRLETLRAGGEA